MPPIKFRKKPLLIWLLTGVMLIVIVSAFPFHPKRSFVIEELTWVDYRSACSFSFRLVNNVRREQQVVIQLRAERTRESRVGTLISVVGSKKIQLNLAPKQTKQITSSMPLAASYSGQLVIDYSLSAQQQE